MFGEIIKDFRIRNGLSQTNFVDVVQRSNSSFNNLDVVTLSRWERGITTPHLRRQNELLDLIGVNLFDIWDSNDATVLTTRLMSKLNSNGYINTDAYSVPEFNVIGANNLYLLRNMSNLIDVIFEYEDNIILGLLEKLGLSRRSIIEKIINQYSGELILVTINGQLIGHILSSNYQLSLDFIEPILEHEDDTARIVISFNCTHHSSFIGVMGREAYKYIQSLNPRSYFCIFLKNKKMFDLFFTLGFDFRSISVNNNSMKVMYLDSRKMKSQRSWMDIISNYVEKYNE
ncbi:Helix-turn-helix transcriptional regulator [Vibrio chagasii]|uniref:helix-turn-helix domain-containing protein n=1 Tax=Vibrio TaxID=662 RepID=UPI000E328015|nr:MULTISPECIES: helix-turn-helix transcriptional regulator [Vibrio]MCG9561341.1 helix-turn-helix domain-containing protein [Vibrio chagasii]MCG9673678.1 helix-turn-helix domain-containing protein [Vibrio chagasii]CAH6940857.1 Helix-turn-helix transcriptional regulator [Vibrio chagasii]CAH6952284.1 Helix-turn-helix transcriptional regulator [Vibrio chagasii]CAH6991695.1 Helix-turn-helix transcriptional regulator [Vibrio chagasii]